MVANLTFGFWVSLLSTGGALDQNKTIFKIYKFSTTLLRKMGYQTKSTKSFKSDYEVNLWRPILRKSFYNIPPLERKQVHNSLDSIRIFRNRIVHHESILNEPLEKRYNKILEITGWISPQMKDWISKQYPITEITKLLDLLPDD